MSGRKGLRQVSFLILIVSLLYFVVCVSQFSTPPSAHANPETPSVAPLIGVRAGVWADGQAAFWDFNISDHFRYFGPKERARGFRPEQPIKFSHELHVRQNKIECQFCHWSVAKAPFAALPEMEVCTGCHGNGADKIPLVSTERTNNSAELKKLHEFYQRGEPIPWIKVHVMPDYLRFNHKRHVKAGVACHECHGQVPEMEVVERVSSMKMGWCVSCHREEGTSIDCAVCHY